MVDLSAVTAVIASSSDRRCAPGRGGQRSCPVTLTLSLPAQIAVQDDQAAGFLDRTSSGWITPGRESLSPRRLLPRKCFQSPSSSFPPRTPVHQTLRDDPNAAGFVDIRGDVAARRLQVREQRRALADLLEVIDVSWTPASRAIASRCRTALVEPPVRRRRRSRFRTRPGQDYVWGCSLQKIHHHLSGAEGDLVLARIDGGNAVEPIGERPMNSITVDMVFAVYCPPQAPGLGHATFSISCSSASSFFRRRWRRLLRRRPGWLRRGPCTRPGDGAPVEDQAGKIEAGQRHGGGGNGFVTAHQADHRVEHLSAADQLDRVGDDFAADQGGASYLRCPWFRHR